MMSQHVIRAVVWLAAAIFLLALALRDLQLDRALVLDARLDRATSYLSTLGPPARVQEEKRPQGPFSVRIISEPVYINLRIPRLFRRATVELAYENPDDLPFRFGVRTHPTQWAFQFPDAMNCPTLRVGQSCRRVAFDLQRAWQVERNVYRFVLSLPGASPERPLTMHSFHVTAQRDPICIARFCV